MGDNVYVQIETRCATCQYGNHEPPRMWCTHPYHPGVVNAAGCEWAATCSHFRKSMPQRGDV